MLYITTTDGNNHVWYVGTNWNNRAILMNDIVGIQADGDELERIRTLYPTWTPNNMNVVRWSGDFAKTISINLGIATY